MRPGEVLGDARFGAKHCTSNAAPSSFIFLDETGHETATSLDRRTFKSERAMVLASDNERPAPAASEALEQELRKEQYTADDLPAAFWWA